MYYVCILINIGNTPRTSASPRLVKASADARIKAIQVEPGVVYGQIHGPRCGHRFFHGGNGGGKTMGKTMMNIPV